MQEPPLDLEPMTDLWTVSRSIGDMLQDRSTADGIPVRALVPGAHDAYVRILHPAWRNSYRDQHIRWREIAEGAGARLEATVAFRRITVAPGSDIPKGPSGAWAEDATPLEGTLPEDEARVLFDLVAPAATCWFVMWDGWDGLRLNQEQVTVPRFGNSYLVYRGPLEVLRRFDWTGQWQLPHLWFPKDRAWCVGTDIESFDTYVGGSANLVRRIIDAPQLEAIPVEPAELAVVRGEWLITDG